MEKRFFAYGLFDVILLATVGLGGTYFYYELQSEKSHTEAVNTKVNALLERTGELASSTAALSANVDALSHNYQNLGEQTSGLSDSLTRTKESLSSMTEHVGTVEQSLGSISGTVANLEKLSSIDPQVLKKYSKIYFLNENYTPLHLSTIPDDFTYSSARKEQFVVEALPHLSNMLVAAKRDGVEIYVKSAYRSFAEQKSLKSSYKVVYGTGANTFSADQGYSEHQLGTTADFIVKGLGGELTGFEKTSGYTWMTDNAYQYGFVLSYPKGNQYYMFEPWHWRFVGVKLATYLHNRKITFYDMDQREIDRYLSYTFDYGI